VRASKQGLQEGRAQGKKQAQVHGSKEQIAKKKYLCLLHNHTQYSMTLSMDSSRDPFRD
jgi:flagellar biosynthesis/type III secretory pathway protein FliH